MLVPKFDLLPGVSPLRVAELMTLRKVNYPCLYLLAQYWKKFVVYSVRKRARDIYESESLLLRRPRKSKSRKVATISEMCKYMKGFSLMDFDDFI